MSRAPVILIMIAGAVAAQPNPIGIPQRAGARPVLVFIGAPAVPRLIAALATPQNPFMVGGAWGDIHHDSYIP